jgi:hypothetical protein
MKPETTKPLVTARKTAKATVFVKNTSQVPTSQGPQLEDPPRAATARAAPAAVAVEAMAVVAVAEVHLMAPVDEMVAAAIAEADATRTAMSPAVHVEATMLTTGSTRFAVKRLLKQATAMASQPSLQDFATCFFLRNSNVSGSPSTT